MGALWKKIENKLTQVSLRAFMPDLARQMQAEGTFDIGNVGNIQVTRDDYLKIVDNGADVTIFAFSGLDVLYAGLARFEFQKVLNELGYEANFVFVRDLNRIGFHLTPDCKPGGLEFYENVIRETKEQLGAPYNIAIGSSMGAFAAFNFGTRCGMDQIIMFGAAFAVDGYTSWRGIFRTFFDAKKFFTEPRAYFELVLVTIGACWVYRQMVKWVGNANIAAPLRLFHELDHKPRITLFYGATAWADAGAAESIRSYPNVRLIPLPTGRHNTPAFLKQRGDFAESIAAEIRLCHSAVMAERAAAN
ncbi:MAG: hypothetical protein HYV27_08880 [Candidatus Hydrogenedentes bacterium]|nr:hypothetical protein [Candidatus Hydrogenedentota bacterium]